MRAGGHAREINYGHLGGFGQVFVFFFSLPIVGSDHVGVKNVNRNICYSQATD